MSTSPLITVPAAFVLILASTATVAQDKSGSTTGNKPVTTLSKAAKHAPKPATVPQDTMAKTVRQGSGKENVPSAAQSAPVSERSHEGCHHAKDSDA